MDFSNHTTTGRILLSPLDGGHMYPSTPGAEAGTPAEPDPSTPGAASRPEFDCIFLVPGHVKAGNGDDTNWLIPADVVERDAPLFAGVASYLDHPELFGFGWRGEPQVKDLIGVTTSAQWDPLTAALTGTIRLYDTPSGRLVLELLTQILADQAAGRPVPDVGLSAVFYHETTFDEESGLRVTTRFKKVESVDLVYSPGAGGYVKAALAAIRPSDTGVRPSDTGVRPTERSFSPMEERVEYITALSTTSADPEPAPPPPAPPPASPPAPDPDMAAPGAFGANPGAFGALAAQILARLDALEADLRGEPEVSPPQTAATVEDLHAQVQHLSTQLARIAEPATIQGLGRAPRDPGGSSLAPARLSVADPLGDLQSAWDWIFGVDGAPLPSPELRRTDYLYRLLTGDLTWTGVFDEREALASANPTTLPGMAVNAMNKVIIPLYDRLSMYRWFEMLVSVQPTDGTLHDMAWLQFGGIGDLPVVADGAAYTELTVADSKETAAFVKYGGYVGITEKMIRNSDIARIQAVPRALTISAVQTRSAKIAAIFTASSGVGPTLAQDSTALFHANHGNLATTAFSWSAWKAARIECMKQAELGSAKRQALVPRYCLVPVDLYDEALQVFGYGVGAGGQPGTGNNDVNPYAETRPGDPRPIPIAVPEWTDTNDWAYLADPMIAPVIQMAYADNPVGRGHPAPQLFTVTSKLAGLMFTNDVLPIKVRDYWTYGVATYRGIGKRNVT
jgi:hypothetical protein